MSNIQTTYRKNNLVKSKGRRRGDITDPKTHEIANRFKSYQRKSAECFIEMGRIVVEAKKMSQQDFADFCLLIGYDWSSSTIRKLKTIGDKYEYLISRSDKLPPNWTVLYEISRLSDELIEDYINTNRITPLSNGTAIDKLLVANNLKEASQPTKAPSKPPKNVPIGTSAELAFTATLKDSGLSNALFDLDELLKDLEKMGFDLDLSEGLKEAINQSKTFEMALEEA